MNARCKAINDRWDIPVLRHKIITAQKKLWVKGLEIAEENKEQWRLNEIFMIVLEYLEEIDK